MWQQDGSLSPTFSTGVPQPTPPPYLHQSPESKNGLRLLLVYLNQIRLDWEGG